MTEAAPRPGNAEERRAWILATLRTSGFLRVADLARQLGVSQMTVRRDLRVLESTGEVRLFHGGASLAPSSGVPSAGSGCSADSATSAARERVARAAASLIGTEDTIVLDAGPTAYALAQAIPDGFAGCVITHSMPVLRLLDDRSTPVRTVALGGELLAERHAFVGPTAEAAVVGLRARTYFFAPAAVDSLGAYAASSAEAGLQRKLLEISEQVVLLATEATFSGWAPTRVAPLDQLTGLVTDRQPPAKVGAVLRQLGVVPHVAP